MPYFTQQQLQQVQEAFNRWDKQIVKRFGYYFKDLGDEMEVFNDSESFYRVIKKESKCGQTPRPEHEKRLKL